MKKISQEELKEKLELHKKWLNNEKGGVRLDLSYANLSYANLSYANLRRANLKNADLEGADLYEVNLSNANLKNADLSNANLSCADLSNANLSCADLSCANLNNVDLSYADLRYADLNNVDLSKAKFYLTTLYKIKGDFVNVGNIGSRNDTTHYFYKDNRIICGCFDGTMKEFEDKVKETYEENSKEYKQYIIVIDTLKRLAKLEGEE